MAYELGREYVWKEIGDQVVILHLDSGRYYTLNPTGSLVWKCIMEGSSTNQVVERICSRFEVDEESCRSDAEGMIRGFAEKGMIVDGVE